MPTDRERTALVAGATGLVGGHCLRRLLEHPSYRRVIALVRRPADFSHPKLEVRVVDFDRPATLAAGPVTDVFCTLGTTIANAGSEEAFRRVDYGYTLALAAAAMRDGARSFVLVSSVGADPAAPTFYLRTKGETERDVMSRPFRAVHVLRPGLLLGHRAEPRMVEGLARVVVPLFNPLLVGPVRRFRAIPADTVAAAMIGAALEDADGPRVLHYDEMIRLGTDFVTASRRGRRRPPGR